MPVASIGGIPIFQAEMFAIVNAVGIGKLLGFSFHLRHFSKARLSNEVYLIKRIALYLFRSTSP